MSTETTQSSQTRLWAGVVSSHAPTSWGGAQSSRSLPVGSSTTSSFRGRGSSVDHALWKERLMYVIYISLSQIISTTCT